MTVARGAKFISDNATPNAFTTVSNTFDPIDQPDPTLGSDSDSPAATNPLVNRLKVVDEKEGKDLKNKQIGGMENPKAAKKRKGKGKTGNTPPPSV